MEVEQTVEPVVQVVEWLDLDVRPWEHVPWAVHLVQPDEPLLDQAVVDAEPKFQRRWTLLKVELNFAITTLNIQYKIVLTLFCAGGQESVF